jgi:GT2 family glycosyltransferase
MSRDETAGFSVIVPTRNRPKQLETCLTAMAQLSYPRDRYEVIVVDDGGETDVTEIVRRFVPSMTVIATRCEHAGPAAARNFGVAQSSRDRLAFTDDDCTVHPDWLSALDARMSTKPHAMIGGRVINALPANPYSSASQSLQDFLYHWYHEQGRGQLPFFTTNNLAMSRRDFERIGGFDVSFTFASEDRDISDRGAHAGLELVYAPEAIVRHAHDLDLRQFITQHFRYGEGAARFHTARASRRRDRVRLEPPSFYLGMMGSPMSDHVQRPLSAIALLFLSQSASFLGFAHARATRWAADTR